MVVAAILAGALLAVLGPDLARGATVSSEPAAGGAGFWTKKKLRAAEGVEPPLPSTATPAPEAAAAARAANAIGLPATVPPAAPASDERFVIREGGGGEGSRSGEAQGLGGGTSTPITDPAARSVRMHGRLFFRVPGSGKASCSATAINSNRRNLLLTAAHCVHGGGYQSPWFKDVVFIPAYEGGSSPFGRWEAKRLYVTGIWAEYGDPTGDVAMVATRRNKRGKLQDVVGARGIAFNRKRRQTYTAYGYPAEPPFDGERERFCRSPFRGTDEITALFLGPETMAIDCDMTGGASGGSWVIKDRFAVSVNSYGYAELPDVLFGPRFGALAKDLYMAGIATCRRQPATHVGGAGRDRIVGTGKRDVIVGGGARDTIRARGGKDLICGGAGPDRIDGGRGADRLRGQSGGDHLVGGKGKDTCRGGGGKNRARGCEREIAIP